MRTRVSAIHAKAMLDTSAIGRQITSANGASARAMPRSKRAAWSRLIEEVVPGEQSRSERSAGVARRRLNPNVVERAFPQNATVSDTIQSDAARQTKIARLRYGMSMTRHPQHHFLRHRLQGTGHIHVPLC